MKYVFINNNVKNESMLPLIHIKNQTLTLVRKGVIRTFYLTFILVYHRGKKTKTGERLKYTILTLDLE